MLFLFFGGLAYALYRFSPTSNRHPSVGVFHSGEMATMNGLSGRVTLEPQPDGSTTVTLKLLDQEAQPVSNATVSAHGVAGKNYGAKYGIPPSERPGIYSGWVIAGKLAGSIMVHANLPGGKADDWVAEWTLEETVDVATE